MKLTILLSYCKHNEMVPFVAPFFVILRSKVAQQVRVLFI